jgi:GDPmannose 4,6-dehydratase
MLLSLRGKMKSALITGIFGQDAAYLAKLLLSKNYKVYGGQSSSLSTKNENWRLKNLGIDDKIKLAEFDLRDSALINSFFKDYKVDEVYNLAGHSSVSQSFNNPTKVLDINTLGTTRILESITNLCSDTKFFQAASSEIFGNSHVGVCNEETIKNPVNPYGLSKLASYKSVEYFRQFSKVFACSGILFNHESPLRDETFVTRKITSSIAQIANGNIDKLEAGNIHSKKDWGHAADYVEAIWQMLQVEKPTDYIIGTGKLHSVKDIIDLCFNHLNIPIQWQGEGIDECAINTKSGKNVVCINEKFYRPIDSKANCADPSKIYKELGWKSKTSFESMIINMLENDLNKYK